MLGAALWDRVADLACTLTSGSSAWAGWALWCLAVSPAVQPLCVFTYAAGHSYTARWGHIIAVWAATWHDAHGRPQRAARVRMVNGLT